MSRALRARMAEETLRILESGAYGVASGRVVDIASAIARCVGATQLYTQEDIERVRQERRISPVDKDASASIDVVNETTLSGLSALGSEGDEPVAVLNFASAKNPGGGFLGGSQAQEESLARSSALYASLVGAEGFYLRHRASASLLYSDSMIHSPFCPVFRDDDGTLLETPLFAGFITAAAPNAGAIASNRPQEAPLIESTLIRRAEGVLALAAEHGYRRLLLGAWGCGVFRNDPATVARIFADHLVRGRWRGVFDRVRFSVLDPTQTGATFEAFRRALQ